MAKKDKIENLEDLIKDTIGGEVVEQKAESLLPPGENYGSVMYRVDFKVKKNGKIEEYHAVAKCTPHNALTQEIFSTQETFKTEIGWYTTVIPTLKQFQKDHGVEKGIDFFQEFYGARISLDPNSDKVDLDGVLLTRNLKYLGYDNVDRHVGFDLATTYSVLRDLATFHAVPLAIRTHNPELFNEKIAPNIPKVKEMDNDFKGQIVRQNLDVLERIPECQPYMARFRKNFEKAKLYSPHSLREPWVTVVHADYWSNNIMVTEEENPKTIILDLQLPMLGSPARDLVFVLLTSVKLDLIQEKFDDFVKFYYEQFAKNLKELKVPMENYPFTGLLEEIEEEIQEGEFTQALSHCFIILTEKGETHLDSTAENTDRHEITKSAVEANERQIEKFRWMGLEAVKRNWI